ncbi:hypothetical protein FOMPIDRAFT_1024420 [Fomitopsis schrenkii]|uniref:Uncharacterized protein n=1 Tax=Fomitopsis schrenkii TaxID=2126942 RepID=S8E6N1_FOMSC|nr:hypothetical protein FOMPIDRAFT_1024420 [Fomitopsis schrenkii]
MKAVIWGRIHAKIREDEKVRGLDESTPSQPKNRIPFHDLHDLSVNNEPGEEDIGQENGKVPRGSVQGTSSARTNLTGSSRLHPMPLRER